MRPTVSPQRRNLIFTATVFGLLMAALDQTIVATALPTIVSDWSGQPAEFAGSAHDGVTAR